MRALVDRLTSFHQESIEDCRQSIVDLLPRTTSGVLLDCGCADGSLTLRFADAIGTREVLGIEFMDKLVEQAEDQGIKIVGRDLNQPFALDDASVDVVTANQVIEHLADTDQFLRELHRVLRPGGTLVLSTNNLASWHNIAPLLVGAQPFAADVSNDTAIGKLFGLYEDNSPTQEWSTWTHLRIYSHRALIEMLAKHHFEVDAVTGVGYYPLSGRWARRVARADARHAAYVTVRGRRTS